jgi:hypothetical protein
MIENKFHTIHFTGCSFTEGGGFEDGKHRLKLEYKNRYGFLYKNENLRTAYVTTVSVGVNKRRRRHSCTTTSKRHARKYKYK